MCLCEEICDNDEWNMFLQVVISYTIMQIIKIKLNDFVSENTFIGGGGKVQRIPELWTR